MDRDDELSSTLLALGIDHAKLAELKEQFAKAFARSQAAWPGVVVDESGLLRHAITKNAGEPEAFGELYWEDLYVAFACLSGSRAAHQLVDTRVLVDVPRYVSQIESSAAFADEVRQRMRERLFAGPAPKIGDYTGRGPLGGWVRVAAVRTALNLRRERSRADRREEEASDGDLFPAVRDPELEYLRARHARDVKEVFAAVLTTLTADQRNVLRMHYLDSLTLDEIGVAYGVHRATAARWIQQAREAILALTRQRLQDQLKLSAAELDSVIALVQTRLESSLRRMLGEGRE
jgi:RNA polymerase sigma-70 factor (ECF subfamily)